MQRLRYVMIVFATVIAGSVALAPPATAVTAGVFPRLARPGAVTPSAGGSNDYLNGDSCPSSTFCMAVGAFNLNGHSPGLSEMLSGGNWLAVAVPSPARGVNIFANEVSCASPVRCLFVGEHWAGKHGPAMNLAEAWNGSSWRTVTTTGPVGAAISGLDDVACPNISFCMAVGFAGSASHYQDAAYRWNSVAGWRRITIPRPGHARNSVLNGLACFSSANCMAVGDYTNASGRNLPFAAHWHNGRWTLLTTPAVRKQLLTTFQAIDCPTATKCVAVGNTEDNTAGKFFHAFAEVWRGGRWRVSTLRRPPSVMTSASCPAWNRCFASGYTFPPGATFAHPLIETWDGRTWTTQRPEETPAPRSGASLQHVSCVTRTLCEAVGFSFAPSGSLSDQTLAEIWNGHRWIVQATPNP